MDYLISIDDERGKSLLAFLQKLDFIVLKPYSKKHSKSAPQKPVATFAYFGFCPDWDIEADDLRKKASPQRSF